MALKEGLCPNCGSLLQLDDKKDQGHCLFCDAVFTSNEAFAIAAAPAGVTFPNLPQPKYDGPNLNPQLTNAQFNARATQVELSKRKESTTKDTAKSTQPVYTLRDDIKIPDLKLSVRTRLLLSGAAVLVIALIAGISTPPILARDADRKELYAAAGEYIPVAVDVEKTVVIHGLNNQRLQVALPEAVTAEQAVAMFKAYSSKRASITGKNATDFAAASDDLTVHIITPAGGFMIDRPDSLAVLEDGSAVQTLS